HLRAIVEKYVLPDGQRVREPVGANAVLGHQGGFGATTPVELEQAVIDVEQEHQIVAAGGSARVHVPTSDVGWNDHRERRRPNPLPGGGEGSDQSEEGSDDRRAPKHTHASSGSPGLTAASEQGWRKGGQNEFCSRNAGQF